MPVITLQLGQCGNQLGSSFFHTLAAEFGSGEGFTRSGVEEWFRPLVNSPDDPLELYGVAKRYAARAVLIDMEPKVVQAARATAAATGGWWSYPKRGFLTMQSGAGNNWAHGFHGYGPKVHEASMELVRREAEACDLMGGFLVLQSMAGGTGAGLGTYVAQALRDEFPSSHCINCCVWPYESGEVLVQSYNTLLTLSHLSEVSDGIITMENEALHRVCKRLYNLPRPSFSDMNSVAARAMACMLLPSIRRPAYSTSAQTANASSAGSQHSTSKRAPSPAPSQRTPTASSQFSHTSGVVPSHHGGTGGTAGSGTGSIGPPPQGPTQLLSDLVVHLCSHPLYRLVSLRALPHVPPSSIDFSTFTWPAINKRLRQMLITGSTMEEGLDWGVNTPSGSAAAASNSPAGTAGSPPFATAATAGGLGGYPFPPSTSYTHGRATGGGSSPGAAGYQGYGRPVNKSLASWLVLRGQGAGDIDVCDQFSDPGLYAHWALDPLAVSYHPGRFARCDRAAALCSNDQSCAGPIRRMQERAYSMLASKAFVHQYQKYGLGEGDFQECFAHVEDIAERYQLLA